MRGFGLSFDDFVEAVTRVGVGAAAREQLLRDRSDGGEVKLQILKPGLAPDRVPYSPIVSDPEPKRCESSSACASALDYPRTFPAFVIVIHPAVVCRLYCLFDWLIRSFILSFFLSFFLSLQPVTVVATSTSAARASILTWCVRSSCLGLQGRIKSFNSTCSARHAFSERDEVPVLRAISLKKAVTLA
jgi:hypothetical protein